jgi:hypothetical protein
MTADESKLLLSWSFSYSFVSRIKAMKKVASCIISDESLPAVSA